MAQEVAKETEDIVKKEVQTLKDKTEEYKKKGKNPFQYDAYGPGIMPQKEFDKLRYPDDPDFKEEEE